MSEIYSPGSIPGPPATFLGAYNSATSYSIGQAVSSGGSSYVSLVNANLGNAPASSPAQWGLLAAAGAAGAPGANGQVTNAALATAAGLMDRTSGYYQPNQLNLATNASGYLINGDGSIGATAGWITTGFIRATGSLMLANFNFVGNGRPICCYDINQVFLGTATTVGGGQFSLPDPTPAGMQISLLPGTAYIRGTGYTGHPGAGDMIVFGDSVNPPVMPGSYVSFGTYPSNVVDAEIAASASSTLSTAQSNNLATVAALISNGVIPTTANVFNAAAVTPNVLIQPPPDMYPATGGWTLLPMMYAGSATHFMANFPLYYHADFVVAGFDALGNYLGYTSIPPTTWPLPANTPVALPAGTVWFQTAIELGIPSNPMIVVGGATPTMPSSYVSFGFDTPSDVDTKIAASAATVTAAYTASLSSLGGGLGAIPENRPASVAIVKNATVNPGAPQTIFSQSGGPGSVERIQLAYSGAATELQNSILTFVVDGVTYTSTCGMFFLNIGINDAFPAPSPVASEVFSTKWLERSLCQQATQQGVGRRIYIPYQESCSITIVPAASAIQVYTQVEFYPGAPPPGLHPVSDKVFHMATLEYNASAGVAPYGVVQLLTSAATGPGRLADWHIAASGNASAIGNQAGWLEFAPSIAHDGTTFGAGGTEDFFGTQYYGVGYQTKADEFTFSVFTSAGSGLTYTLLSRHFDKMPLPFTTSLGPLTWANGQGGLGPTPLPTQNIGMQAVWYTAS